MGNAVATTEEATVQAGGAEYRFGSRDWMMIGDIRASLWLHFAAGSCLLVALDSGPPVSALGSVDIFIRKTGRTISDAPSHEIIKVW